MQWLEQTFFARLISETIWGFPINEIVHILAFSTLLGCVVALAGLLSRTSAEGREPLLRYLRWTAVISFPPLVLSGFTFFASYPDRYIQNAAFLTKLPLLLLLFASLAVLLGFSAVWQQRSLAVRRVIAAGLVLLTLATLVAGRLIAYVRW